MTVYQNDCGTGSQLAAYSWAQQQARTDFNLNFNLTGLQVIASGNYNTDVGLAAGIYAPAASGPQNYNFGLGLPYLQLLLCQKCSAAITALPSALDNVVVSSAACPGAVQGGQGWTSSSPDLGRLSVAQAPGSPSPALPSAAPR